MRCFLFTKENKLWIQFRSSILLGRRCLSSASLRHPGIQNSFKIPSPPQSWQFMTLAWHGGGGGSTTVRVVGEAQQPSNTHWRNPFLTVSVTPLLFPVTTKAHSCWKQLIHYPALKSLCSLSSNFASQLGCQCLLWSHSSAATCGLSLLFVL